MTPTPQAPATTDLVPETVEARHTGAITGGPSVADDIRDFANRAAALLGGHMALGPVGAAFSVFRDHLECRAANIDATHRSEAERTRADTLATRVRQLEGYADELIGRLAASADAGSAAIARAEAAELAIATARREDEDAGIRKAAKWHLLAAESHELAAARLDQAGDFEGSLRAFGVCLAHRTDAAAILALIPADAGKAAETLTTEGAK